MNGSSRPRGWMRVPPPLLYAIPLLLGLLLHRSIPLLRLSRPVPGWIRWLGIALIAAGTAHTLSSAALFARLHTTIVPHRRSSVLVMRGAYRWTRNPMYLGLALVYVGVSVLSAALWPLLLLPLPILVLNMRVIPVEEQQLREAFGASYTAYSERVRRWI